MQTTHAETTVLNRQHEEDSMRYTTVTPSSGQDNAVQKSNASIRDHYREVVFQQNRGYECLRLITTGKFYFSKEEATSTCNVGKSDRRAPSGIFCTTLKLAH